MIYDYASVHLITCASFYKHLCSNFMPFRWLQSLHANTALKGFLQLLCNRKFLPQWISVLVVLTFGVRGSSPYCFGDFFMLNHLPFYNVCLFFLFMFCCFLDFFLYYNCYDEYILLEIDVENLYTMDVVMQQI